MARKLQKETEQLIIELYQKGNKLVDIAKEAGVKSTTTISNVIRRNNIPLRNPNLAGPKEQFSKETEQEMIRLYIEEEMNTNEIAKVFNTYNTSIRRVLLRNNIILRNASEAHRVINLEDISSKEGTPDFDYFLGLLATDGCVTRNRIVLDFSEENKELLDYWNEFLGNKCSITTSFHKVFKCYQYRIAFRNADIVNYLEQFGIIPNKTFDLELKYINWNVLRGIIDGDGCVSDTNHGNTSRISITSGCKKFLEQIQEFYKENNITSYLKESNRNKNITYDLYVYNTDDILKIYNNLYSNAHYFLRRKLIKFGPLLQKCRIENLVNSGKEGVTLIPSQAFNKEGVETLYEIPKSK